MKVVFFKVENLLNTPDSDAKAPSGQKGIATPCLKAFKRIAQGTRLVLTGSWTKHWDFEDAKCTPDGAYLNRKLDREGLHILAKADDISDWLDKHKSVTEYCVLDNLENVNWQVAK